MPEIYILILCLFYVFCGDVLLHRLDVGWCALGDRTQSTVCIYLRDAAVRGVWTKTGSGVYRPDVWMDDCNVSGWSFGISKM